MPKQRSYDTRGKQKKNPLHCGTITRDDLLLMQRAGRRQDDIDAGVNKARGTGLHGGNKRQKSRRERQESRKEIRDWK